MTFLVPGTSPAASPKLARALPLLKEGQPPVGTVYVAFLRCFVQIFLSDAFQPLVDVVYVNGLTVCGAQIDGPHWRPLLTGHSKRI